MYSFMSCLLFKEGTYTSFPRETVVVGETSPDLLVVQKSVLSHLHDSHGRMKDEVKNTKKIWVLQSSFRKQHFVFPLEDIIVHTVFPMR